MPTFPDHALIRVIMRLPGKFSDVISHLAAFAGPSLADRCRAPPGDILAVPPAIPALREEFSLTGTEIGALSGTPIVIFAVASLAGSRLVARIGVIAAATAGLLLTALGSATRSLAFDTISLFAATVGMRMGVAVAQPAMPALVGRWLPKRLVLGSGVYTNGLLVGEILPVALPLLLPVFADNWRATFALCAAPIVAIAVLTFVLAPREGAATVRQVSERWWPGLGLSSLRALSGSPASARSS